FLHQIRDHSRQRQPRLHDWPERSAMNFTWTEAIERLEMFARRVALVVREPVTGITGIEFHHERVTRHLRDDAGRCDHRALRIAVDDRLLVEGAVRDAKSVDEYAFRCDPKLRDRPRHCQLRS